MQRLQFACERRDQDRIPSRPFRCRGADGLERQDDHAIGVECCLCGRVGLRLAKCDRHWRGRRAAAEKECPSHAKHSEANDCGGHFQPNGGFTLGLGFAGGMAWPVRGAARRVSGGGAGFVVDGHAQLGQGAYDRLQGGILPTLKKLDTLDASELICHRFRDLGLLDVDGQNALAPLGGQRDFLDDILRVGRVFGDGEDEHLATANGGDDFLAPHRGALDAHLVDPHRDTGGTQALDEVEDAGAILGGVADEDFGGHGLLYGGIST